MVQPFVGVHRIKRTQRTRLRVGRREHAAVDTGLVHQPRAHDAGLERHIHRAAGKPPHAQMIGCRLHGQEFRVPGGVIVGFTAIAGRSDQARLRQGTPGCRVDRFVHHNRPDRHLAHRSGNARLLHGEAHIFVVGFAHNDPIIPIARKRDTPGPTRTMDRAQSAKICYPLCSRAGKQRFSDEWPSGLRLQS